MTKKNKDQKLKTTLSQSAVQGIVVCRFCNKQITVEAEIFIWKGLTVGPTIGGNNYTHAECAKEPARYMTMGIDVQKGAKA